MLIATSLWLALPGHAQQRSSAAIYGTVTDSQGAVIAGARVSLLQTDTGQSRAAVTNSVGAYEFPLIPVGPYRVAVEHPGFKKYEAKDLLLQVNDNVKLDIRLEVGEVTTTVAVEASGIAVNTDSSTIKEVVDSRRVVDLPLNGRNLADLTLLVPGVQPATNSQNGDAGLNAYSRRASRRSRSTARARTSSSTRWTAATTAIRCSIPTWPSPFRTRCRSSAS